TRVFSSHVCHIIVLFFLFTDPATPEIYTLSLHDALPICFARPPLEKGVRFTSRETSDARRETTVVDAGVPSHVCAAGCRSHWSRSEEHMSELQSRENLVCRLLLEKKKKKQYEKRMITSNG